MDSRFANVGSQWIQKLWKLSCSTFSSSEKLAATELFLVIFYKLTPYLNLSLQRKKEKYV